MSPAAGRGGSARLWRWLAGALAALLIGAALLLGTLRFTLALVPENSARLQQWIEAQTRFRLEFDGIDARMRWSGPEVVLRNVRVLEGEGTDALFKAREGTVSLDFWSLFRTGEFVAGRLRLVGPDVTFVRLADGQFRLLGLGERPLDRPPFDLDRLPAGRVEIQSATVHYRDLKSGGGPWTLEQVSVSLQRERETVRMSGSGRLPAALGSRIEFSSTLQGSLGRPAELDARLELKADRLELAGFADFLPDRVAHPTAGSAAIGLSLRVADGRIAQLRLSTDVVDLELDLPVRDVPPVEVVQISKPYRDPGAPPLSMLVADKTFVSRPAVASPGSVRYAALSGEWRLRREGDVLVFRTDGLRMRRESTGPVVESTISGRWRGHSASAFALGLQLGGIRTDDWWPLLLAAAPASFDRWAGIGPSGEIAELGIEVTRERAGSQPLFSMSGDIRDLATQPVGRWPGIAGITATLSGTEQRGRVALRAEQPVLDWPRMFREPIRLQRAEAEIDWYRDGPDWVFSVPQFSLLHTEASAEGSVQFRLDPGARQPVLSLDARLGQVEASLVSRVLPVGRLQPRTIVWLESALQAGHASNGRVSYQGPVRRFPFRNGEGEFTASADVSDVRLEYFNGFAPLTGAQGKLEFRNAGLQAGLSAGSVGGLRVQSAGIEIKDLKEPFLEIEARASGDVAGALALLQGSPLGPMLGTQFMQLTGQGPADFGLDFDLATGDQTSRDYTVTTSFRSATLALPALRAPATGVSGTLVIRNLEVRADDVRGTILGGPFRASVRPGPVGRDVTASVLIDARGRAQGSGLPRFIGLPDTIRMSGGTEWQLDGRLERRGAGEQWPARFAVSSDLAGLTIAAPRPFAKAADETRPTSVTLRFDRPGRTDVEIQSGSARGILAFATGDGGRWNLERGAARFDGQPVSLAARPGLQISGDWPEFDLGEWLTLRGSATGERRLSDWLGAVDVHLDRARVLGFGFTDVTARLQAVDDAWRIDVTGPMAAGRVTVPLALQGPAALSLEMQRLVLKSARDGDGPAAPARETDPRELPALDVRADEFTWNGRQFGRLQAVVGRDPLGLRLEKFSTRRPDFGLTGTGTWFAEGDGSRTRVQLEFSSTDLAAASRALGYRESVDAEEAHVQADLTWSGGLAEDAIERMDGSLRLELRRGQLRGVKPGAGRILGLMSVAELPRRLSLDFRDVTDEGLAFDSVVGDFDVRAGNAHTENLLLRGASVDIGVVGRTGLAAQDYDQTVVVSGSPSGPITVAGALAGGPVGAAGALLISQIFKGQLQGLARVYYRVTGSWAEPRVERISAPAVGNQSADPTQALPATEPPKEPAP